MSKKEGLRHLFCLHCDRQNHQKCSVATLVCSPQIDAVSLFLLYLVEMICSGLQIIYNTDEVRTSDRLFTYCHALVLIYIQIVQ